MHIVNNGSELMYAKKTLKTSNQNFIKSAKDDRHLQRAF